VRHYKLGRSTIPAVDGVSLQQARRVYRAAGSSGSGKSTLLNLIGGLDRLTLARLWWKASDLATMTSEQLAHTPHIVGMVFQSFNLVPTMTPL